MLDELNITTQKEVGGSTENGSSPNSNMPWTAKGFQKHNKKLSGKKLAVAAKVATAMVKKGLPEGEAIATGNKVGKNYKDSGSNNSSNNSSD